MVPGLPGRLGLPILTTKSSHINPIFESDFPDPSILQITDGWPRIPGDSPSYEQQSDLSMAIGPFTWITQRSIEP